MIDALFGSKTRVKLLHLFLNNPGKSFYVREITRLIDEQINSVRRELSNMLDVGIIVSESTDNKLFYEANQRYEHYAAFRAIFADSPVAAKQSGGKRGDAFDAWRSTLAQLPGIRIVVAAGSLVPGSVAPVDLLLVGSATNAKLQKLVQLVEKAHGREVQYAVMPYDEFYYRLSVRDRFVSEVLQSRHHVLVDQDSVLKTTEE